MLETTILDHYSEALSLPEGLENELNNTVEHNRFIF